MRKLLYIACYFPPLGGVASIRAAKQTKYLAELGFEIQVLTVRPAWMRYPRDASLLEEIPSGVKITRACLPDPNWLFKVLYGLRLRGVVNWLAGRIFIPDPEICWLPFAKLRLRRLLRRQSFDLALISSGPPSSLLLGPWLARKFTLPYVCEFRDEWTNNHEKVNTPSLARALGRERRLERKVLVGCSGIAYLSEVMRDNFLRAYPFLAQKPSVLAPNGFDESDFQGIPATNSRDIFHLVFCGRLYGRLQPDSLWQALAELLESGALPPAEFHVDIYGNNSAAFVLGRFQNHPLISGSVRLHPYQNHRDNVRSIMGAEALLIFVPSGNNAQSVLTGKLFDYLRSGKPILALVPQDGLAAQLVTRAQTGFVADTLDSAGIKAHLLHLFRVWKEQKTIPVQPDWGCVGEFSRRSIAQRLGRLLEEAAQ